jgi:general secretion pathway protein A
MTETFYGEFYGFASAPFHITPDPRLLFPTKTHHAALGAVEYGIKAGKGFIVVTGEVGVGKTTVLKTCLDGLDPKAIKVIYLLNPALTTTELYREILDGLDVPPPPALTDSDAVRLLFGTLLAVHREGMQVVLSIDEAQRMPEETLESLRLLSNLETRRQKLLQIVLVGQPELEEVLAKHHLRQLAQRIAVRAHIAPLSLLESCRYIDHRARLAGRSGRRRLFTMPARLYLAYVARGIPRTINIVCDNALINGYGHGARTVSLGIAREAYKAMRPASPLRRAGVVTAAAIALAGLAGSAELVRRHFLTPQASPPAAPAVAHNAPPPAAEQSKSPTTPMKQNSSDEAPGAPLTAKDDSAAQTSSVVPPPSGEQAPPAEPHGEAGSPAPTGSPAAGLFAAANSPASADSHVAANPAVTPIPPVAADSSAAAPSPAGADAPDSAAAQDPRSDARRVVRGGDTLYRLCVETYGTCDPGTLRAITSRNPQIGKNGKIHAGEVIYLPRPTGGQ